MSKYFKVEDVIRKRAEDLADTSYWEYGNAKNVDEWIEVAEMEFKDLPTIEVMEYPQVEGITPTLVTTKVSEDCSDFYKGYCARYEDGCFHQCKDAPSVVPSRAEGEWQRISPAYIYQCSVCGGNVMTQDIECYKYCHQCGERMKAEDKERD